MKMSTKHEFAFLCSPKCASTSIEAAISKFCNINFSGHPGIKHINAQVFSETILPTHQNLVPSSKIESFCLIRDPLEWIESWYRFRARDALKNPQHPNHTKYTGNISYNEFIQEYISKGKRKPFANLKTQYQFVSLNNGHIGVDYLIPMHNFELVNIFLSEKIGREIKVSHENISPKIPADLDPDINFKLRKHLEKDLVLYNFAKEHGGFNKALHSDKLSALLEEG
jgi:hypothetical protein